MYSIIVLQQKQPDPKETQEHCLKKTGIRETEMLLSRHPPPPIRTPVTPFIPPQQQGRTATPWPFYVQALRPPSRDIKVNAARVLDTAARYFFSTPQA
jgi:hypothetical protein